MNVYQNATDVVLTLPFEDNDGNQITPTALSYCVLAGDNAELVASTPVVIASGAADVSITVTAANNTLGVGVKAGIRNVKLTFETASGTFIVNHRYILEVVSLLEFGVSSFQTYNEALLEANYMVDVEQFKSEDEKRQRAALLEAFANINQLTYLVDYNYDAQSSLFYNKGFASRSKVRLSDLTSVEFANLPPEFIKALKQAQVAEADYLLGGETVDDKRRSGLLSESVGESSNMFRTGKPLQLPVSKKALGYISYYVSWSVNAGR